MSQPQITNPNNKLTTANDEQISNNSEADDDFAEDNYSNENSNDSQTQINNPKLANQTDSARDNLQPHNKQSEEGYHRKGTHNKNSSTNLLHKGHGKSIQPWRKKLAKFIDSTPVLIVMSVFTVFVLFITDIQAAFLRKNVDYALNIILSILLGTFVVEFVLACIAKSEYPLSFFFGWI